MKKLFVSVGILLIFFVALAENSSSTAGISGDQQPTQTPPRSMIGLIGIFGLWVDQVEPNSPAALVGLQPGDIVTRIDKTQIEHKLHMRQIIGDAAPGLTFRLYVRRYEPVTGRWEPRIFDVTSVPYGEE